MSKMRFEKGERGLTSTGGDAKRKETVYYYFLRLQIHFCLTECPTCPDCLFLQVFVEEEGSLL